MVSLVSHDALLPAPVLVVEDDPVMRQRLWRVLGGIGYAQDVVSFSTNLAEARTYIDKQPLGLGLALVDLGLPDGNGIELIQELRALDPAVPILVISAWSSKEVILGALRAGATGYLLKERDDLEVSLSIRSVLRGGAPIDPFIAQHILAFMPAAPLHIPIDETDALSARESEILEWVSHGLSNREIAEKLTISRHTVECHITRIYRKLAVTSRTRAVNEARQRGLLS